MRRAALRIAAAGALGLTRLAGAEPWTVTMEAGAEGDSNVQRVETEDDMGERISAPVGRAGARVDHKGRLLDGSYGLAVSGLARMVANNKAKPENVMLFAGDTRWLRPVEGRPVSVGVGVTAADAFAITGGRGARTFRNLGGDGILALGSEDRLLTLAIGWRAFKYKPIRAFSWYGPVASARLDIALWQATGKTRSLELATVLTFEARTYNYNAFENICRPEAPCLDDTSEPRTDRFQRANTELNWMGDIVATLGYQLTVVDSNSFGQSLIRHRMMASVTAELADKLFGSATATLQLDQYPDGLLFHKDDQHQELTNLDDQNRSSLQVRLARELTPTWSLEARAAVWRDFDTMNTTAFRRELVYAGVICSL